MQPKLLSPQITYQKLDLVGSSTFGINPKILASRTFNMMQSDDWLVDYAGYRKEIQISEKGEGRAIFSSVKSNSMIAVIDSSVYDVTLYSIGVDGEKSFAYRKVGTIDTDSGDVFIDANNVNQIAICDQFNLYIWDFVANTFTKATMPDAFVPGYVTYQDGRFISPDRNSDRWALSDVGNGLNWLWGPSGEAVIGAIQTKPDFGRVAIRFPGRGNLLLVLGSTVGELWTDVGGALFPYQKSTSINFDYGCANPATVASSEEFIAWLGSNEKSESVIMFSTGNDVKTLSTDGINNKLALIRNTEKAVGFFVKVYGHLIYQLTFFDPRDNFSIAYDFTTNKFFDMTDENMNFHIARHVAFFKDEYYFVSISDGNIYQFSSEISSYDYIDQEFEIPRIRVCSNFRLPDASNFIVANAGFTLQQGNDAENVINSTDYEPRIGLSLSRDGGITFGSYAKRPLNKSGIRRNKLWWDKLGSANDLVAQFRFWGRGPWNAFDGTLGVYQ